MAVTPRDAPSPLLTRRLVIVTGKGGTGKTTVAAALALAAARRGLRVVVTEVARDAQSPRLLEPGGPAVGYEGREVAPRLRVIRIDPFEALGEYLGLQLGVRSLVDLVLRNPAFHQLMEAAPGWRELITLGKVWHLEQMREDGAPRYDLIVVDAPATGHGVTFLDVPRVVVSAVRAGPLRHHTERVEELIADPERTLLLPVALAEELPARETIELVARVRDGLSIRVDRVVVNAINEAPFPEGLEDLDERLARLPASTPLAPLPDAPTLATCARSLRVRHELNLGHARAIAEGTGLPLVRLPYLRDGVRGPADLERLADYLLERERMEAA